ncbi:MAG: GYD family protein [Alphaproteobacteria bacterium CG_4_9_14_3_um_filter_47_13]|nr:MAG: GYD family protein [Alphaproteobacteria bacterium CG_4_9_14_3_um_filter_47_13]
METFILLTRLVSEEVNPSFAIQQKEKRVMEKIEKFLPDVKWNQSFSITGPWDYIDIFDAPDKNTAMKVSALVRYYGGAHTEIWAALEWSKFKETLHELAEVMEK